MAKRSKGKGGKGKRRSAAQKAATARMVAANKAARRTRSNPARRAPRASARRPSKRAGATVRTVIVNPGHAGTLAPRRRRAKRRSNPGGGKLLFHLFSFGAGLAGGYLVDALADAVIPAATAASKASAIRYGKIGGGVVLGLAAGLGLKMPAAGAGFAIGAAAMPVYEIARAPAAAVVTEGDAGVAGLLGFRVGPPMRALAENAPTFSWPVGEAPTV